MRVDTRAAPVRAFSLVEVIIVVSILAILAALVVPRYISAQGQARAAALAATVDIANAKIEEFYAINNAYPATIDPAWFAGGTVVNPYSPDAATPVQLDATGNAATVHPQLKIILGPGSTFWYNPTNGKFRGLVPRQDDADSTVALYNQVNDSNVGHYFATTE